MSTQYKNRFWIVYLTGVENPIRVGGSALDITVHGELMFYDQASDYTVEGVIQPFYILATGVWNSVALEPEEAENPEEIKENPDK